jgi:hypothetical protein
MSHTSVSHRTRRRLNRLSLVVLAGLLAVVTAPSLRGQQTPPPPPPSGPPDETGAPAAEGAELVPPATDPGETPSGALAFFMGSRDYRTIRDLKTILTPQAKAAYDHDSVSYNGRKGVRLAAWDYREPAPKPGALTVTTTVRSLWDEQGEAVEQRTENVRLQREATGPWRVAALAKTASENLRFKDAIPGVTSLRMVLRAWRQRDLQAGRPLLTDALLKRLEAKGDGLAALFTPPEGKRHAAFRIQSYTAQGTTGAVAKVGLVEVALGRPGPLDGTPRTLTLIKKGSRWLVDDWR